MMVLAFNSFAQAPPQGISYQSIARDTSGNPIIANNLVLKFEILNDTLGSSPVYTETHANVSTNKFGLFTLVIGSLDTSNFKTIDWTSGEKYLHVEIATVGANAYHSLGKHQLMSVPYALYSQSSGNAWKLNGNTTAGTTNFIGTTDSTDWIVKTNNSERIRIIADGKTGIGTNAPSALMEIKGVGTDSSTIGFLVTDNASTPSFIARDNGMIGIGTLYPNAKLSIIGSGNDSTTKAFIVSDNSSNQLLTVRNDRKIGINNAIPNAQLDIISKGDSTAIGLLVSDSLTRTLLLVRNDGNVGIGNNNPPSLLSVGTSSPFQVDSTGAIVSATGIISSGNITFSSLSTNNGIVRASNGNGTLSVAGGAINLATEVTNVLPVANGGTGISSLNNWQTFYSDGSGAYNTLPLGNIGTVLQSNGNAAAPSWIAPSSLMQTLSNGSGISPFAFNGSSNATVSLDSTGVIPGSYNASLSGQILTIPGFDINAQGRITNTLSTAVTLDVPVTFTSGLTRSNDTARLGGNLQQPTTIKAGIYNMRFVLDSTGDFRIVKNSGGSAFHVKPSNGNIGIGTGTPLGKLQVNTDATVDFFTGPGLNAYGSIHLVPETNISDNSMGISFGATDGLGSLRTNVQAGIYVQGSGFYGTKMYFATTDDFNTAGAKTRMVIDHLGKVGIGTISPFYSLDIKAAAAIVRASSVGNGNIAGFMASTISGTAKFFVETSSSGNTYTGTIANAAVLGNDLQYPLQLATNGVVNATFLPTGEFGIGTTAPKSKLDVTGGVTIGSNFSGNYMAPTSGAIIEGKVGIGTTTPQTSLEVTGAVTLSPSTTNFIADGNLTIGNNGYLRLTSSTDVSITAVTAGIQIGQMVIIENANASGGNKIKFLDNTGVQLSSPNYNINPAGTLTLIWNGTDWLETARADN